LWSSVAVVVVVIIVVVVEYGGLKEEEKKKQGKKFFYEKTQLVWESAIHARRALSRQRAPDCLRIFLRRVPLPAEPWPLRLPCRLSRNNQSTAPWLPQPSQSPSHWG